MVELDVMDALTAVGQALVLASLAYFFYLVLRHGDLLCHAAHEGDRRGGRPRRAADPGNHLRLPHREKGGGTPEIALDEIADAARLAGVAR